MTTSIFIIEDAFQNALNYVVVVVGLFFFSGKKQLKNMYVPTLPNIFRPVTQNSETHLHFVFGLSCF